MEEYCGTIMFMPTSPITRIIPQESGCLLVKAEALLLLSMVQVGLSEVVALPQIVACCDWLRLAALAVLVSPLPIGFCWSRLCNHLCRSCSQDRPWDPLDRPYHPWVRQLGSPCSLCPCPSHCHHHSLEQVQDPLLATSRSAARPWKLHNHLLWTHLCVSDEGTPWPSASWLGVCVLRQLQRRWQNEAYVST